jgi:hypothetical protein
MNRTGCFYRRERAGSSQDRRLQLRPDPSGDVFGLTNIGTLARSTGRIPAVLEGIATGIFGDIEYQLSPGDCMGFKAGTGIAHQVVNRTDEIVTYVDVGDRSPGESAGYPEDDLTTELAPDGSWTFTHKDGTNTILNARWPSIASERDHRLDARRATGRQIASENTDRCHHQERSRETERVRRRHSVEQTSYETGERQSRAGTDNEAKDDHRDALSKHQEQDFSALRAQSHSNPDLDAPLADEMRDNAEDANQRQGQRDDPECRQEHGRPSKILELARSVFFDRADLGNGQRGIDFLDSGP